MSNRRFWIISLPRADMEQCIKAKVFGLKRKYLLGSVQTGDGIACYVTKDAKVIALGEVTKGYYCNKDKSSVFLADGSFPHRIEFLAKTLGAELDFRSLIDDLRFISNPAYWGAHLQLGITEIPKVDWELINRKADAGKEAGKIL